VKNLKLKPLTIDKLTLDDRNANKGTKKGRELIAKSVGRLGLGRSIVVDSSGRVIAGNKTLEAARAAGVKNIQLVESNGETLVVVRRSDLDLKKDKKAKELAIADNRTNEVDLSWDNEVLGKLKLDLDLSDWFDRSSSTARVECSSLRRCSMYPARRFRNSNCTANSHTTKKNGASV